ncbi:o-succinylbenzoate synthase [Opitutus sp. GAS368]|uniref:o-succinylbenzoate synthase n=1 Tax=Opitutus sp. GAS368 TaxID=1882749 RepID=UPI000879692D|nr:o-succinylbenzoate synthase [Opitutus sp. GAS368]SDS45837.1 O-succinylbenzoate synthase [Opitutus sp. GAS368]
MAYRFEFKPYRLPLRAPLRTAHGAWTEREGLLVRLEDPAGRVGYGEIAPLSWFGTETLAEAGEICRKFGATVTDELLDAVPSRFGCVRFALACAKSEVERGLRTRLGESTEQKTRPEAGFHLTTNTRLPVAALLPAGREALAALPAKLEAGYLAFKWKVGVGAVDDELGIFDDLLAALPAYAKLRLDANGGWDRRQAAKWLARCAERPVEFVEQPVNPGDEAALLGLAADFPVTLALDESVTGLAAAQRWQGQGWRGVFVLKPALTGPLAELAAWVAATKADIVLSSAIETALGRAAILRAALTQPLTQRALGFGVGEIFGDRRWDGPFLGPVLDGSWIKGVEPEVIWNALNP